MYGFRIGKYQKFGFKTAEQAKKEAIKFLGSVSSPIPIGAIKIIKK